MYDKDKIIREHLKTLTVEDISDSTYLFGVDFDTDSLDTIFNKLITIYDNVKTLRGMIDNDFKSPDDIKILMPSTPQTKSVIIQDCARKESALEKALANPTVYDEFVARLSEIDKTQVTGRPR